MDAYRILIIVSFLVIFSTNSYSNVVNEPIVEKYYRKFKNDITFNRGAFKRNLGYLKYEILLFNSEIRTNTETNLTNNYDLVLKEVPSYSYKEDGFYRMNQGYYIINKPDNMSHGYCLIEPIITSHTPEDITLQKIKTLSINQNYLQGDLNIPSNGSIKFYENVSNGFIERYTVITYSGARDPDDITLNLEVLLVESFYPSELDSHFKPKVKDFVNHIFSTLVNDYPYISS